MKATCLPLKKPVLFWGLLLLEADLLLELGILEDLVQSRGDLRVQHLEVRISIRPKINHLHFFDPQHGIRWKIRTI